MTDARTSRWRGWMLVLVAFALSALGLAAGALRLTAVEPNGSFVDCGPAVFGRPSPLPDPSCGPAYNQLPIPLTFLTYVLIGFAVVSVIAAITIEVERRRRRLILLKDVHI